MTKYLVILLLAGCQSVPHTIYLNEIPLSNPEAKCSGKRHCSELTEYRGKPMCTVFLPEKDADSGEYGAAFGRCLNESKPEK